MEVTMQLDRLMDIVSYAVDAGVQSYRRSLEPEQDYVKRSELKRYISRMGYKPCILDRWIADDLIHERKNGSNTSAYLYSFADVKNLLLSVKLKKELNRNMV